MTLTDFKFSSKKAAIFLPVCLLFLGVLYHAIMADFWSPDDEDWLNFVGQGIRPVWTSGNPWNFFRPSFGIWMYFLNAVLPRQPAYYTLAGLLPILITWLAGRSLFNQWMDEKKAGLAAVLLTLHPIRHSHYFWTSAQIDSWCLAMMMMTLALALRTDRAERQYGALRCAMLLLMSMVSFWFKEIALLLIPLVLLLPSRLQLGAKIKTVLCISTGLAISVTSSMMVLGGLGQSGSKLAGMHLRRLLAYPIQIVLPIDQHALIMNARTPGSYLPLILLAAVIAVGAGLIAYQLVKKRESWLIAGLILLAAGGCVCMVDPDHRGLGLGAAGFSLLFVGALYHFPWPRMKWFNRSALVLLICCWAAVWCRAESVWRGSKQYNKKMIDLLQSTRDKIGPDRIIVQLVGLGKINNMAIPEKIFTLDHKSLCVSYLTSAILPVEVKINRMDRNIFSIHTQVPAMFEFEESIMAESGIVGINRKREGIHDFIWDGNGMNKAQLLQLFQSILRLYKMDASKLDVDSPFFVFWDGKDFKELAKLP